MLTKNFIIFFIILILIKKRYIIICIILILILIMNIIILILTTSFSSPACPRHTRRNSCSKLQKILTTICGFQFWPLEFRVPQTQSWGWSGLPGGEHWTTTPPSQPPCQGSSVSSPLLDQMVTLGSLSRKTFLTDANGCRRWGIPASQCSNQDLRRSRRCILKTNLGHCWSSP